MEDDDLSKVNDLTEIMKTQTNTDSLEILAIPKIKDVYGRLAGLLNYNVSGNISQAKDKANCSTFKERSSQDIKIF